MSAKSDALKLIAEARERGFEVVKLKHGGYGVMKEGQIVTRIPTSKARRHWVRRARRDLEQAA